MIRIRLTSRTIGLALVGAALLTPSIPLLAQERVPADTARPAAAPAAHDTHRQIRVVNPSLDSAAVLKAVDRFQAALAAGERDTALALLADHAVVLESGSLETRSEYAGHHLPADIEFAKAVASTPGPRHVVVRGDVAWVIGTSVTKGTFRKRPVHSAGAELMVLERIDGAWKIAAIHWSSRNLRPAPKR